MPSTSRATTVQVGEFRKQADFNRPMATFSKILISKIIPELQGLGY